MNPKDQRVLAPFHKMLGEPVIPAGEIRKIPFLDPKFAFKEVQASIEITLTKLLPLCKYP
jgi:hypothetical protein